MNILKDVFKGETRKWMNLVFSAGVAALGVWAIVVANIDGAALPTYYDGLLAGWMALGGYLGLQSASNITPDTPDFEVESE